METWQIMFLVLFAYPIIAFFIISLTKNNIRVRKITCFVLLGLTVLVLLASFSRISTIYLTLDWVLGLTIYLFISVILWWLKSQQNIYLKILSIIGMIFVFGFGASLGLSFMFVNIEAVAEQKFGNGLIYREYTLGHATTDNRGKQIEIHQVVSWLPIIETFVQEKTYNSLIRCYDGEEKDYENKLTVNYAPNGSKIYLSTVIGWLNCKEKWADTLTIKK